MLQVQAGYSGDEGPGCRCPLWILWKGFERHLAPAGIESRSRSVESLQEGWAAWERILLGEAQSTQTRVPGERLPWVWGVSLVVVFLEPRADSVGLPAKVWPCCSGAFPRLDWGLAS